MRKTAQEAESMARQDGCKNKLRTRQPGGRRRETEEPTADDSRPRIDPGEYDAICCKTEYGRSWGGRTSLYVTFIIYGGPFDGVDLYMACPRPAGKLRNRHKLYEQWSVVLGREPQKGERFNKNIFRGKMCHVLVRDTDRKFSNGKRKPDFMQYSVVQEIIEVKTGVQGHQQSTERT